MIRKINLKETTTPKIKPSEPIIRRNFMSIADKKDTTSNEWNLQQDGVECSVDFDLHVPLFHWPQHRITINRK